MEWIPAVAETLAQAGSLEECDVIGCAQLTWRVLVVFYVDNQWKWKIRLYPHCKQHKQLSIDAACDRLDTEGIHYYEKKPGELHDWMEDIMQRIVDGAHGYNTLGGPSFAVEMLV